MLLVQGPSSRSNIISTYFQVDSLLHKCSQPLPLQRKTDSHSRLLPLHAPGGPPRPSIYFEALAEIMAAAQGPRRELEVQALWHEQVSGGSCGSLASRLQGQGPGAWQK